MLYSSLIRFPSAVKRSCPSGRVLWIISDRSNGLPPICYTSYGKSTCYWKQKKSHHSRLEAGRFLEICRSPRTKKYSQKPYSPNGESNPRPDQTQHNEWPLYTSDFHPNTVPTIATTKSVKQQSQQAREKEREKRENLSYR